MRLIAFTDGGSDGKGEAYIGVLITDLDTGEVLVEHSQALGQGTNNEAEYSALIFALYQAEEFGATELRVRSDSKLVVNQIRGEWAVHKDHIGEYVDEALRAVERLPKFSIEWVPRGQNTRADALSRVPRPGVK